MPSPVEILGELFASEGGREYFGEPVSVAAHMLQAATSAARDGARDHLVAAALLHDIGHIISPRASTHTSPTEEDLRHEHFGADWLSLWFPPEVTEPVRLHVPAKRYLCALEAGYLASRSPASVRSLDLQGGPMTPEEAFLFSGMAYAAEAVAVRRWDEQAKNPDATTLDFDHFRPLLERVLRSGQTRT